MDKEERDELGVEQMQDSRFDWTTAVNENSWYYSQYWVQKNLGRRAKYCVVKQRKDSKYYVSECDDTDGQGDIGPFNSLEDAASVCVMKNYGN